MKTAIKLSAVALVSSVLLLATFSAGSCAEYSGPEPLKARITGIAGKIGAAAGLKPRILVVPDFKDSACVLPDKTIILTSSLVNFCKSDDELAFVIAHEVSHIIARDHVNDEAPKLASAKDLPESQLREIEADRKAVGFMKKAGYGPDWSFKLLSRLVAAEKVDLKDRLEELAFSLKALMD